MQVSKYLVSIAFSWSGLVQVSEFLVQISGFLVQVSKFLVQVSGSLAQVSEFPAQVCFWPTDLDRKSSPRDLQWLWSPTP